MHYEKAGGEECLISFKKLLTAQEVVSLLVFGTPKFVNLIMKEVILLDF